MADKDNVIGTDDAKTKGSKDTSTKAKKTVSEKSKPVKSGDSKATSKKVTPKKVNPKEKANDKTTVKKNLKPAAAVSTAKEAAAAKTSTPSKAHEKVDPKEKANDKATVKKNLKPAAAVSTAKEAAAAKTSTPSKAHEKEQESSLPKKPTKKNVKIGTSGNKAVVVIGGKQYVVEEGMKLTLETFDGQRDGSKELVFKDVKMLVSGGTMISDNKKLTSSCVKAVLLDFYRGPKKIVFKKKRRQGYRRFHTHRQNNDILQIVSIEA